MNFTSRYGGSGGGIQIQTTTLAGTGWITATGGKNSSFGGTAGGGGGRIAVYYDDLSGFTPDNIIAYGGTGTNGNGGAGTIYLKSSTQTYGDLIIDNNNSTATTGYSTPLISVGQGYSTDLTIDTLTDNTRNWRTDDLIGIYLNPKTDQPSYPPIVFPIRFNDSINIIVDNTSSNITDIAYIAIGDQYIGENHIDNLTIVNGARVETLDNMIYNTLDITGGTLQAANEYRTGKLKKKNPLVRFAGFIKGLFVIEHGTLNMEQESEDKVQKIEIKVPLKGKNPENPVNPVRKEDRAAEQRIEEAPIRLASLSPMPTGLGITSSNNLQTESLPIDSQVKSNTAVKLKHLNKPLTNKNPDTKLWNITKSDKITHAANKMNTQPQKTAEPEAKVCSTGFDPIYTYDLNGNRSTMTGPLGGVTNYEYDNLNRLTKIINPDGKETIFNYDANSRRTSMTLANGVASTYTYDAASRLTSMSTDSVSVNISSHSYTYDNTGNSIAMSDNYGNHDYVYDDQYRLTSAVHPQDYNPNESFSYDPVGNRLSSHLSSS